MKWNWLSNTRQSGRLREASFVGERFLWSCISCRWEVPVILHQLWVRGSCDLASIAGSIWKLVLSLTRNFWSRSVHCLPSTPACCLPTTPACCLPTTPACCLPTWSKSPVLITWQFSCRLTDWQRHYWPHCACVCGVTIVYHLTPKSLRAITLFPWWTVKWGYGGVQICLGSNENHISAIFVT